MGETLKTTVYIVDDDSEVRRSTWFALSEAGFTPRAFASGVDLLDEIADLAFGVVLLDLRMPDRSGLDVLREIVASQNALPVIMVTGFGDVPAAVAAMKIGAADFIEKPFDIGALAELIEAAAQARRHQEDEQEHRKDAQRKLGLLTTREREVLDLLLSGLPNKIIAYRLELSPRTVEMHRASMMQRLVVTSLSAATRLAIAAGFTPGVSGKAEGEEAANPMPVTKTSTG